MSKTFDNISEASATNYLFLFAQRTLGLRNEPPTPPPLNALGLPCEAICRLWTRLYPENTYLSLQNEAEELKVYTALDFSKNITQLAEKVTAYIIDHQDDAAQEDRWRTTMKRDMGKSFRKVKEDMQAMDDKLDRIVKELGRLTAV